MRPFTALVLASAGALLVSVPSVATAQKRINLGYLDPDSVKIEEWAGREAEDVLVVPRAGEMLYRLAG